MFNIKPILLTISSKYLTESSRRITCVRIEKEYIVI